MTIRTKNTRALRAHEFACQIFDSTRGLHAAMVDGRRFARLGACFLLVAVGIFLFPFDQTPTTTHSG